MKSVTKLEPPKQYFNYNFGHEPRTYTFVRPNGSVDSVNLRDREKLTVKCKVCDNYMVSGYDEMDRWHNCPCCGKPADMLQSKAQYIKDTEATLRLEYKKIEEHMKRLDKQVADVAALKGETKRCAMLRLMPTPLAMTISHAITIDESNGASMLCDKVYAHDQCYSCPHVKYCSTLRKRYVSHINFEFKRLKEIPDETTEQHLKRTQINKMFRNMRDNTSKSTMDELTAVVNEYYHLKENNKHD